MPRIIAGEWRGLRLRAPAGDRTRPITDRAKETLFNVLGHRLRTLGSLPPFDVLDLFAGTGSLGLEALSRGAARCTFVENGRDALVALLDNLRLARAGTRANVARDNAWTLRLPPVSAGYGLIFVDPPYRDADNAVRLADLLSRCAVRLAADGVIVLRHGPGASHEREPPAGLSLLDARRFKDMRVLLLGRAVVADALSGADGARLSGSGAPDVGAAQPPDAPAAAD